MSANGRRTGEFTGRHMFLVMAGFFAVIIAVNVGMATMARTSWTGLVVANTYVASQQFNGKAEIGRAQAALGWTGVLSISGGETRYLLKDGQGRVLPLASTTVAFRHPAYEARDMAFMLAPDGASFSAATVPADGVWIVEIEADAGLEHPWRDVRRIVVANGAIR